MIQQGRFRPFSSTEVFQLSGHEWSDVLQVDERLLGLIPKGESLQEP